MGNYVSIRGWFECDDQFLEDIQRIINEYSFQCDRYSLDQEQFDLYMKGWRFPQITINWTCYLFFGADIRDYADNLIKDQIIEIANLDERIEGYFRVYYQEIEKSFEWIVRNKCITEKEIEV